MTPISIILFVIIYLLSIPLVLIQVKASVDEIRRTKVVHSSGGFFPRNAKRVDIVVEMFWGGFCSFVPVVNSCFTIAILGATFFNWLGETKLIKWFEEPL